MNEVDGWDHIHHAAFRGFVKSVERFVKSDPECLEKETEDELRTTPLLLAAMSGIKDVVECLVSLGANITALNQQNHGVVELCAFKQHVDLLHYFHGLDNRDLPVWKLLIKFMGSVMDEEAEAGAKCIHIMTLSKRVGGEGEGEYEELNQNIQLAYENGIVPAIVNILKGEIADNAKQQVLEVMLNMATKPEATKQAISVGMVPPVIKLLKATSNPVVALSATVISVFSRNREYSDIIVQNSGIQNLVKVLQTNKDSSVLVESCKAVGTICDANPAHRETLNGISGAVKSIVALYDVADDKNLTVQHAVTNSLCKMVDGNPAIQTAFVQEDVAQKLMPLIKLDSHRQNEIKMAAVEAVYKLADQNGFTQKALLDAGMVRPLLTLLKRSRQTESQEKIADALWALAGQDSDGRTLMAEALGVQQLVEFLNTNSERLIYIGSEGISVLAESPEGRHEEIYKNNGVSAVVRLLKWDKEYIVLSGIRTLRSLSLWIGFMPQPKVQITISQVRGVKFLVALMVHSKNEEIQVESAYTLACVTLGNKEVLAEVYDNLDFNFVRILKMLYSPTQQVRLTAGAALAAFAYNNVSIQKQIVDHGGILFSFFAPFLQSDDEHDRCLAAFQVVVLARIIPDQEQATSSATGIKLLCDLLKESQSETVQSLTCDCVARLVHTRAGVPQAFVAIDCVDMLCTLLTSQVRRVQGNAAIALGFLSHDHQARRELLNRCRLKPPLMDVMKKYCGNLYKSGQVKLLSGEFMEGWQHYKQVGLPATEHFTAYLPSTAKSTPFEAEAEDQSRTGSRAKDGGSTSRRSHTNSQSLLDTPREGSISESIHNVSETAGEEHAMQTEAAAMTSNTPTPVPAV